MSDTEDRDRLENGRGMVPVGKVGQRSDIGMLARPQEEALLDQRKSWEGYARDYRLLANQLVDLQVQHGALRDENAELRLRYDRLQAQRSDDRQRMAMVARNRDALEANSITQANRTRLAEQAAKNAQLAVVECEETARRLRAEKGEFFSQVEDLQRSYSQMNDLVNKLKVAVDERDQQIAGLSSHIEWQNALYKEQNAKMFDLATMIDVYKKDLDEKHRSISRLSAHIEWQESMILRDN